MEIVLGYVFGSAGAVPRNRAAAKPRDTLEHVVRDALLHPPCAVAFSGGRDSSLVLAIATHVARRDGLPEPVPITRVFPGVSEADEERWQEAVVRHLRLQDWQRIVLHDELDVVGPYASEHLREFGVVWPPAISADVPLLAAVTGGSLVNGEGGDNVLGVGEHRVAPVTRLVRSPRPVRWRRIRPVLRAGAPSPVRIRGARREWATVRRPWLRPAAHEALLDAWKERIRAQPFSFEASVRRFPRLRAQLAAADNRRMLARRRDVRLVSPLLHPDVVSALARDGGVLGKGDRTAVLRGLAADLLPDEVLARTSKASFNTCYMAGHARAFAARWAGDGVDHDLVDAEELRRAWLAESPLPVTAALLQAAWLADVGLATCSGRTSMPQDVAPFHDP